MTGSNFLKNFNTEKVVILLVFIIYFIFQFPYLFFDLWNDEIYTLKYFTFVSPLQTITDYHAPNNHILFNLINNFYLKIIGEKSVYTLMEHPWVLRIISLLYAFGTILFSYRLAEKTAGKTTALLSVLFLCSSVPFYNYAVEIRGYSLSILLITAVSYYFFSYLENPRRGLLFLIAILTAAAFYTIPLNIYSILSMCLFLFLFLMASTVFKNVGKEEPGSGRKSIILMLALIAGVFLTLLLYSGIYRQVFFNEYVIPDEEFSRAKWIALVKEVYVFFFSYRYWLFPVLVLGFSTRIYLFVAKKNQKEFIFFLFLITMLIFPFIISYIRRDAPPDRTFINLIPFFAMLMAWLSNGVFILIADKKFRRVLLFAIGIYCFVNLEFEMKKISDHLLNDRGTPFRSHNLYYNYYLGHFKPLSVVKKFKESIYRNGDIVIIHDAEPHDLPEYLTKFNIPFRDSTLIDSVLKEGATVYLFSRSPGEIENSSFRNLHQCSTNIISEGISYHNLFELKRIKNP